MSQDEPTGRGRSFAELLGEYRVAAGLTQAALADRSGLSLDAIGLLERGRRRAPRRMTVELLAKALLLSAAERQALLAAARAKPEPPRSELRVPAELRIPPTPLVGRRIEVSQVRATLQRPDVRLLTLTGPPGVGKTRLALEVARSLLGEYLDGVVPVALAPLEDANLVAATIQQALGIFPKAKQPPLEAVVGYCRRRHLLLVLDNFERLLEATPLLLEMLTRCTALRVLVTSRASLRVRGEHEFSVPVLRLPGLERKSVSEPGVVGRAPAVALFVQRAKANAADFRLTPANAATVAAICHQLDGLPLALELAAPWLKLLTAGELLQRLRSPLALLAEGLIDLPERQRSLRAVLSWSCDLLGDEQRALLRRLSVFAGSASLETIDTVCQAAGALAGGTLGWLAGLSEHSLVWRQESPSGGTRVGMLEVVREYGRELLDAAGETEATIRAHMYCHAALAEQTEGELGIGAARGSWIDRMGREYDNMRLALQRAAELDMADVGLRLAVNLSSLWDIRGPRGEGLYWLQRLLETDGAAPPVVKAQALGLAGRMARLVGDLDLAERRYEESRVLSEQLSEGMCTAIAIEGLGLVAADRGDLERAVALFEEAYVQLQAAGDEWSAAKCLTDLAWAVGEMGDRTRARTLHEQALATKRRFGNNLSVATSLIELGKLARAEGELDRAVTSLREGLALTRQADAPNLAAEALIGLGDVARARGDSTTARTAYEASVELLTRIQDETRLIACLERLAWVVWKEGQAVRAVRLYGAASALRKTMSARAYAHEWPAKPLHDEIRAKIGDSTFAAAFMAGSQLSLEAAMAEACRSKGRRSS